MVPILKFESEKDRQTVQLSLDIETYSAHTKLTLAHFGKLSVNLARISEDLERDEWGHVVEPEKIALSAEEMDALVEAWTSFKAGITAKEQARLDRIANQCAKALALVASVKTDVPALDIKITQGTGEYADRFTVEVSTFSFYDSIYSGDDGTNDLLDAVKRAIARIEQRIARLERLTISTPQYVTADEHAQITAWRAVHPIEAEQGTVTLSEV